MAGVRTVSGRHSDKAARMEDPRATCRVEETMRFLASVSRVALASIPLVALLASTPATACPAMEPTLHPIATKNTTMLPGGGVLLAITVSYGARDKGPFTLVDETGTTIDATQDPIAPGLVRLTPKQHADREVSLVEGKQTLFVVQDAAGAPPLLAIPKIAKVTSTRSRTTKAPRGPYPINETTTITLASAPPANAVALVLYGADKTPRGWVRLDRGRTYYLSFGGKGCNSVGMSGTVIGEDVSFGFVDNGGRVSAMSKSVRVGRTPPPPPVKSPAPTASKV